MFSKAGSQSVWLLKRALIGLRGIIGFVLRNDKSDHIPAEKWKMAWLAWSSGRVHHNFDLP